MPRYAAEKFKLRSGSKVYTTDFKDPVTGKQWRKSLGTTDATIAKRLAEEEYQRRVHEANGWALPEHLRAKEATVSGLTLAEVFDRYMAEVGNNFSSRKTSLASHRHYRRLLGEATAFAAIDATMLRRFVAQRLAEPGVRRGTTINPATVNHDLAQLRMVHERARRVWRLPVATIDWSVGEGVMLREADYEQPVLKARSDEERLRAAMDDDLRRVFDFAIATGLRKQSILAMRKEAITWEAFETLPHGYITVREKSKRPGGRLRRVPLTRRLHEMLREACALTPPEQPYVFTFLAQRSQNYACNFKNRKLTGGGRYLSGVRYPWRLSIFHAHWDKARRLSGMPNKWHAATRGTAITRAALGPGGIAAAQQLAGHSNVTTTQRYVNVGAESILRTMIALEARHDGVAVLPGRETAQIQHSARGKERKSQGKQASKVAG